MHLRIFTLRFSPATGGFDDGPIRSFMTDKEVLSVREHFFSANGDAYWAVMLIYKQPALDADVAPTKPDSEAEKQDYRSVLTDESMPLFNLLREWRNERAKADAIPPYVICNNRRLAEIALKAPTSLNELSTVEGIGAAKLKKYGKDMLAVIGSAKSSRKEQ